MRRALVLSGGGVKGAFQVGVLRGLLDKEALDYDIYTGISVGALNASILATGELKDTLPQLEDLWLNKVKGNKSVWTHHMWFYMLSAIIIILFLFFVTFLTFLLSLDKFITVIFFIISMLSFYLPYYVFQNTHSIYSNSPLRRLVNDNLDVDKLKSSGKMLRIGAVCFETGEYHVADESRDNIVKWIMASSAFPVFFPMEEIDDLHWTDGGIANSAPIRDALSLGATEIDIILASPVLPDKHDKIFGMNKEIMRVVDIMLTQTMKNELDLKTSNADNVKIRVFMPDKKLTNNVLEFSSEKIKTLYNKGVENGMGKR